MKRSFLVAVVTLSSPTAAIAQQREEAPVPDAAAPFVVSTSGAGVPERGTIVVTATRAPTPVDRVASSIAVLDKAAIDRAGDLSVADLLLRTPGVSLSRNGGYGTNTSLRIRGAEADQTVVVIDGVKLNDPSSAGGGYNFANLLTGDASRIEVLRGPQSILWGSQAIGGVVNVVTPLPDKPIEGSFDLEGGSRDTVSARAAVGGRAGALAWRVGAQSFHTTGISVIAPGFGGREKDGYRNRTATARAVLALSSVLSAEVRGYYSDGRSDLDSTAADTPEYALNREFIGYAGVNVALFGGRLRNRIALARTATDRDNYNPARARPRTFDAAGRNRRLEYQGTLAIVRGIDAVFGAENDVSSFRSVSPPANLSVPVPRPARGRAETSSLYAQLNAGITGGPTLTAGIRHDDQDRFGSRTLFAGGAAWALPTDTVLRASYSEGFKAPTLYQLFSEYGNRALAPEQATGWEAGAEQRLLGGRAAFGATYFERRSTDLIVFGSCTSASANPLCLVPGSTTQRRSGFYQNVAEAFGRGIEAAGRLALGDRLTLDGNYGWIVSEDRSPGSATYGLQLARRPRHSWNAAVAYAVPRGPTFGAAVRWSGEAFDNASHTIRFAPYALVDLRGEMPLGGAVRFFVRGENVFDKRYMTAYRYNTLGRSIYAGLRGRF